MDPVPGLCDPPDEAAQRVPYTFERNLPDDPPAASPSSRPTPPSPSPLPGDEGASPRATLLAELDRGGGRLSPEEIFELTKRIYTGSVKATFHDLRAERPTERMTPA